MKVQGYDVKDNVLFQDNKSSILLENNGKASSSKRTKHINIRYFFITDRVSKKEVSVLWCPTGDMIGYYATKPLQGGLFQKFRDQIMRVTPARDPRPGKTDGGVGKTETNKQKPKKGKVIRLVLPGKEAAPQECVGSLTRDRTKAGPRLMIKMADLTIFNQSKGKSGSYAHAARVGIEDPTIFNQSKGKSGSYDRAARVEMQNHSKGSSLLHLTSLK
jgi:co-chaperonin GroES (HSP10)